MSDQKDQIVDETICEEESDIELLSKTGEESIRVLNEGYSSLSLLLSAIVQCKLDGIPTESIRNLAELCIRLTNEAHDEMQENGAK